MDTDLDGLFDEVRLLFHALVQRGERLHAGEPVTMAQRAVLEYIDRHGPDTVPAVARQRRVTRQHIQSLVNPLIEAGYLEARHNPEHKRSRLIALTPLGERIIGIMRQREAEFLAGLDHGVDAAEIRRAADTLRRLRAAIET